MKKIVFVLLIACGIIFLSKSYIPEKKINTKVLFINQVRGKECCQKGSYEFVKNQIDLFVKYHFPATFVLRYDALQDPSYISLFKNAAKQSIDTGIFFEITPQLAKDAGVPYKGNEQRWYRAQYAYLVGYSQEDRKKIIDTAVSLYRRQFGALPKTTGGWMIDTYSAQYLSSVYGVTAHEITREQWGTDGYALYGGSILSAYTPSKNWIFVPARSVKDALPITMIRQTISDPVRNYGDLTSGYTSQPNDYGRTKWFDYFTYLLSQTQHYSLPLAVLGLENSLDKKYQDIYKKQIEYVYKKIDISNIISPQQVTREIKSSYILGSDYTNPTYKAIWIETQGYRARIIQQKNLISLTDLRVFDYQLQDPYISTSSGEKTAFWETPYVFDTSKRGLPKDTTELTRKIGALYSYLGNPDWLRERLNPVLNEEHIYEINGITFPKAHNNNTISIQHKNGAISLKYIRNNGVLVTFMFYENYFSVSGVQKGEYNMYGAVGEGTQLLQEQTKEGIRFTPSQNEVKKEVVLPNQNTSKTSASEPQVSVIYNAPLSLIGRNPARIVVVSKDSGGTPVRLKKMTVTPEGGNFDSVTIFETEGHLGEFDGMYYVDIQQKKAGTYTPILNYNDKQIKLKPLTFVLDCKQNIKMCMSNPTMFIDYMKVKIGDVMNRR
jgi:hypothetical protein